MAHYAFLNDENIVTEVIVGRHEWEVIDGISDWERYYGDLRGQRCVRTSYNANIRNQFAGIGYFYDEIADVFIAPQPFASWTLNANYDWEAPVPKPDAPSYWDEDAQQWVLIGDQT